MEDFYKKYFTSGGANVENISLEMLKELKEKGITTEQFLDYLCQKHDFLLHGSIYKIEGSILTSKNNKIFASNKSSIAIMRSLYSNSMVNLEYPYFINKENPLVLKIHTQLDGKFIKKDKGFIYVVNNNGFKNDPDGSWQFIKKANEVDFITIIETENTDFKCPVQFFTDFDLEEWNRKLAKEQNL